MPAAPTPPPPDWAAIRHAYEATDTATAAICADAGIDPKALKAEVRRGKWRRQFPRPFPPGRRLAASPGAAVTAKARRIAPASPDAPGSPHPPPAESASVAPPADASSTPAGVPVDLERWREMLGQLFALNALKIKQLERCMSTNLADEASGTLTTSDHEREAKAIGVATDNLSKIVEISTDLDAKTNGGKSAASDPDEADRWHRELADRLERLVQAANEKA